MAKKKTGKVFLYGEIGTWGDNNATDFISRLDKASKDNDEIALHINSAGGEVFEGNVIYNKIISCDKPVDVYVDGVAASMASIIMMAGRKIYMAKNAFVMIHAPSSYVFGNADKFESAAKLLRSLESQFIELYSKRTGKTESDVKQWLSGDNWFSAQEALDEHLIDKIVEASDIKSLTKDEVVGYHSTYLSGIYNEFKSKLNNDSIINKTEVKMDKVLQALGLTPGLSEDMAIQAIQNLQTRAKRADDLEKKIVEQNKQDITAMVETAVAEKRITADKKEVFIKIGETSGMDSLKTALAALTPIPNIASVLGSTTQPSTQIEISAATWDKMDKETGALKALKANDPETFQKLFDCKFGKK